MYGVYNNVVLCIKIQLHLSILLLRQFVEIEAEHVNTTPSVKNVAVNVIIIILYLLE